MGVILAGYRVVARLASALPVESLAGRRAATDRWLAWAASRPRPARTIWYHAASVGEALGLEPVIRHITAARPDLTGILTFTSPSLARWPNPLLVARADFAPAETPGDMARVFVALDPGLLVFSRSDLWPEMLIAARRRDVAIAVVGGHVRANSRRLGWIARRFLQPLYRSIRFVGAVSHDDAGRWHQLGVAKEAIAVTGDPRHDQVLERTACLTAVKPLAAWTAAGPTIVAGSVEREDERPLLEAFRLVSGQRPDARLVVVPHDPSPRAVRRLCHTAGAATIWSPGAPTPSAETRVVVVESLGLLSDIYLLADLAYVGGGFGGNGLHATIEPAAYAIPVLAAGDGGAPAIAAQCLAWLNDPRAARAAGLAARGALAPGAASFTVHRLLGLIGRG